MKKHFCSILCILLFGIDLFAQNTSFTLVIDPGHGGKDSGRPMGFLKFAHEKEINLSIALKLGNKIKEKLKNVRVLYTRTSDKFLTLEERADFANEYQADCFLSIHCNSNHSSSIEGTEMHIYSNKMKASRMLAELMDDELKKAGRKSRGIIDAEKRGKNLYVTQYTKMPGLLAEMGYLTHPKEEKFLNSEAGQEKLATALLKALERYIQTKKAAENRQTVYKVQIMATQKPIDIESAVFEELEEKVIQLENEESSKYKYKYLIGHEYEAARAWALAKKVEKMGFKGAFVVQVDEDD